MTDLEEDGHLEIKIGSLEKQLNAAFIELEKSAQELTNSRISIQDEFERKIKGLFPLVHLPHALLKVKIDPLPDFSDNFYGFWNDGVVSEPELAAALAVLEKAKREKQKLYQKQSFSKFDFYKYNYDN